MYDFNQTLQVTELQTNVLQTQATKSYTSRLSPAGTR